ncbi:hypothetical protein N7517_009130 [Penicillium concentricum]|uniref:Rhodopsin domain-containing protein n=1 Tax=Penicillium concentricum TaxID=293559 RepID=A0A9W9RII7_9EURO|nr:uncharacterized protein N7517_009130 [Penicillium concentricum]KAJ5359939.1 hypothetical protein N7517_009130 [Penicillium concentricum]
MNMTSIFGPPPEGINLDENRNAEDTAAVVTVCALAILTIIFRLFVRLYMQGAKLEADDWLIGITAIPLIALLASSILVYTSGGTYGFGLHIWSILFAYLIVYLVELLLIKVSILMFYRRIFGMNWMIWATLFISYGWCMGSMIAALCACDPIPFFWTEITDPKSGSYRYNFYYYYIGNATANVVTDVLILLVPMPIVWKLQMRTTQKIGVCAVLLLGGFVCVASGIRIHYLTYLRGNVDITWALGSVSVWSTVEPCVGIICACLPVLQPFVRSMVKKMPNLPGTQHFGGSRGLSSFIHRISLHDREHDKYDMECRTSPTPFHPDEDLDPLTSVRTHVETDPKERISGEENLDPMAIRVKRVVHWSVD